MWVELTVTSCMASALYLQYFIVYQCGLKVKRKRKINNNFYKNGNIT